MEVTQEMLNAAMKKAVQVGIFPKESDMDAYLKHWWQMEYVLIAALQESEEGQRR